VDADRISSVIAFIQQAENLKNTLRSAKTSNGRVESSAEHTWRLCLMVMMFSKELAEIDALRLFKLCIIHDLAEAITGDIPATQTDKKADKAVRESAAIKALCAPLPKDLEREVIELWAEYDAGMTQEAILAKGFDKLETMLQHVIGQNTADFDYAFNLSYGVEQTQKHPLLREVRERVDKATRERMDTP
jgi:putative hydrolase of HD superfamily